VKTQKLTQTLALLVLALACDTPGVCTTDDDCPSNAFCYAGAKAKAGDRGVCTQKQTEAAEQEAVNEEAINKELVIHSFSPLEAAHGAILLIEGEGFGAHPAENSVTLNGVLAKVLFANASTLSIQVPKNMHCAGPLEVSVGGKTATAAEAFLYLPTAIVSSFAGSARGFDDNFGLAAQFNFPDGIVVDSQGNFYVADTNNNRIRKISHLSKEVSSFVSSNTWCFKDAEGAATLNCPTGLAIDRHDNFYVAEYFNHRIHKVSSTGKLELIVGSGTGGAHDAIGTDAQFGRPDGIAVDAAGNLYVADSANNRIRKISSTGEVSTLSETRGFVQNPEDVAQFRDPNGVLLDAAGNLYVADSGNNRIRKVSPDGKLHPFSGNGEPGCLDGPRDLARFLFPHGMAMDSRNGNLYVADAHNHRIRMVTPTGEVRTLAGGGITGQIDDTNIINYADGTGEHARFHEPHGIAIDASGNLYVTDSKNHRIRKIVLE